MGGTTSLESVSVDSESTVEAETTSSALPEASCSYDLADVLILLANLHSSDIKIPLHIMVEILNYADVLPPIQASKNVEFISRDRSNVAYLSVALPRSIYIQPDKILVSVSSKDQGWSSYPNERGQRTSHTWGELMVSTHPTDRFQLFRNLHAGSQYELHVNCISLQDDNCGDACSALKDALVGACYTPTGTFYLYWCTPMKL